jgi:hypothetical protein
LDALAFVPGALMTRVLVHHNINEYRKYMETHFQLAQEAPNIEAFLKDLKYSVSKERMHSMRTGLQMVETGLDKGMKEVDRKFGIHLHNSSGGGSNGLFADVKDTSAENVRKEWLAKKAGEYEKYHNLKPMK